MSQLETFNLEQAPKSNSAFPESRLQLPIAFLKTGKLHKRLLALEFLEHILSKLFEQIPGAPDEY